MAEHPRPTPVPKEIMKSIQGIKLFKLEMEENYDTIDVTKRIRINYAVMELNTKQKCLNFWTFSFETNEQTNARIIAEIL